MAPLGQVVAACVWAAKPVMTSRLAAASQRDSVLVVFMDRFLCFS
jgi:hypothetical protein